MDAPKHIIIKDEGNDELAEIEFQNALVSKPKYIILEPFHLGEITVRWIKTGNFFHKVSVVTGLAALGLMYSNKDHYLFYFPLSTVSFCTAAVYNLSSGDLCCKYQVEKGTKCLEKIPIGDLSSSNPIVLVRRDDTMRKILHNSVALAAVVLCGFKIYNWF